MKCKPQNLVMAGAVPFGQRWTYYSGDPMENMLNPEYFKSLAHQLRPGDEIRLIRIEKERVIEIADVLVSAKDPEFYVLRKPTSIPTEKVTEAKPEKKRSLTVKKGYQCYQVVTNDENKDVVAEYGTKKEAEEAVPELEAA